MPQLNFKEIPIANLANGKQDTFELFAREFFEMIGYRIISGPDRGSDGGRDIVIQETRTGVGGNTFINWLVSCKHKAHTNSSVGVSDEQDIMDRVKTQGCKGFIGFYSTIVSSALTKKLEACRKNSSDFEFQIWDNELIERNLLMTGQGLGLAQRFFPNSYDKWDKSHHDIDLAMLRVGMPTPVAFKISGDEKLYSVDEILKMYPQGNQYLFTALMPLKMIFCNNIFGITKLVGPDGLEDIPNDYLEQLSENMRINIEHMRQEMLADEERIKAEDRKRRTKKRSRTNK